MAYEITKEDKEIINRIMWADDYDRLTDTYYPRNATDMEKGDAKLADAIKLILRILDVDGA